MKTLRIILFMFLSVFVYGQNSTLLQNVNPRAKELRHSLNRTGDTLVLEAKRNIEKAGIYNSSFEKYISINRLKTKIPLNDIPLGRFVVEVSLSGKMIIITLLRHQALTKIVKETQRNDTFSGTIATAQKETANSVEMRTEQPPIKTRKTYWIVNTINNGHSSRKVMRFGDQKTANEIIEQNKLDLKTKYGKLNELIIWEVYDVTEFSKNKRRDPNYMNVLESDCFNIIPYYNSLRVSD